MKYNCKECGYTHPASEYKSHRRRLCKPGTNDS